jgi:carbonic anhydrase/acetyltransferase-like protein (isoleucine patch superfamily)
VRIGPRVTIGIGAVVEIGAEIGDGAQVGALSVVPKHARLEPGGIYVGAPVKRLERDDSDRGQARHSRSTSG